MVDKNDKVIIGSPETEKALVFAKQLYEQMAPGVLAWNDASNNEAFLGREVHWTNNSSSI
jgi:multiple sugar transport system substrate-binding protein